MHDKHQIIEEPDEVKVSRPVLKTNGVGDNLVEFNCFATLSDGRTITAPPQLKIAKIKLSKQQWHNRNKQFGNRRKGIRASSAAKQYFGEIAKTHAHIANIRQDFLQKTTTDISRNYYRIRIEDLNVRGMMANHKLSNA
ncbi:transposase [Nostoc sp.]